MHIEIAKALIAAGGAIIGAILTAIIKEYLETQGFELIGSGRKAALKGVWKGSVNQYLTDSTYQTYSVELVFEPKRKRITGDGKIYNYEKVFHVKLHGAFIYDRFLKMDYENKDHNIIQFGDFIFELTPDSRELNGRFVGFGHIAQGVVYGTAKFSKE